MDFERALTYLEQKPECEIDFPFDPDVPTAKIKGKMFALLSPAAKNQKADSGRPKPAFLNLKCNPDHALELRDVFDGIIAGYHMNKKHWNSILLNDSVPQGEIERLIDHSYALVVKSLKKVDREYLERLYPIDQLYAE